MANQKVGAQKEGHLEAYGGSAGLALSPEEEEVTCKLSDFHCSAGVGEADPGVGCMCQDVSA